MTTRRHTRDGYRRRIRYEPTAAFVAALLKRKKPAPPAIYGYFDIPTLLIDGTLSPYADLTAALAALAAQVPASDFFMEGFSWPAFSGGGTRSVFTSTFSAGTLALDSVASYTSYPNDALLSRIYLTAADGLSVTYNLSGTNSGAAGPNACGVFLYADDQTTLVDSVTGAATSGISGVFAPTIPSDGYYWLKAFFFIDQFPRSGGTSSISMSATGGASLQPTTARALYDDGMGGTAYAYP